MKKLKSIFAIIGAVLLFAMYASTLVFAIIGSESSIVMLKAAIACTFFIPVMLYAMGLVYRLSRDESDKDEKADKKK